MLYNKPIYINSQLICNQATRWTKAIWNFLENFLYLCSKIQVPFKRWSSIFLSCTLKTCTDPFGHFFILAKIHKTPWSTHTLSALSAGASSMGLVFGLIYNFNQYVCALLPTFLSSSLALIDQWDNSLPSLPAHTRLFTADTVSMCTPPTWHKPCPFRNRIFPLF
jgi:hypothetical protein